MPIDLEMLLSSSNHSFFPYSSYNSGNYNNISCKPTLAFHQNRCVPRPLFKYQSSFDKKADLSDFTDVTSYNPKQNSVISEELDGVRKKKVSFADDKGFKLVEIREIPGAPKWADDVITLLIGSMKRSVVKEKKWKIAFEHPPWPDEILVAAIEENMIALERISVKEGTHDYLTGTVKVKNLSFQKNIFLRVTYDRWLSFVDIPCTYLKPNKRVTNPNTYDAFYFNTKILPIASKYEVIEFCVCFECDGKEYWDNNGGINYRLIVEYPKSTDSTNPDTISNAKELETWTDFTQSEDHL